MRILFTLVLAVVLLTACTNPDEAIKAEDLYGSADEAISNYFKKNNITSAIAYNMNTKTILLVEEGAEAYSIAELIKNQDNRYAVIRRGDSVLIYNSLGASWPFSDMEGNPYKVDIKKPGYDNTNDAIFHKEMGLYITMEVKESDQYIRSEDYEVLKSR
ncbi:hypothetical protein [Paenibacillus wulumuqiensis]|uniref:hypothetical protein n=1 Tax=Paenibacillus wulumuqiensis TaxID=1567107 RepID=UPI000619D8A4|nr:hypothetical protein [Paenibacillus wulumuqiensis]